MSTASERKAMELSSIPVKVSPDMIGVNLIVKVGGALHVSQETFDLMKSNPVETWPTVLSGVKFADLDAKGFGGSVRDISPPTMHWETTPYRRRFDRI